MKRIFVAGDKEDQPSAGRVRGCWSLSSTSESPRSTWIQGDTNPIHHMNQPALVSTFLSYCGGQVSEGFDGQTRTELLEAGNELDRVSCQP